MKAFALINMLLSMLQIIGAFFLHFEVMRYKIPENESLCISGAIVLIGMYFLIYSSIVIGRRMKVNKNNKNNYSPGSYSPPANY